MTTHATRLGAARRGLPSACAQDHSEVRYALPASGSRRYGPVSVWGWDARRGHGEARRRSNAGLAGSSDQQTDQRSRLWHGGDCPDAEQQPVDGDDDRLGQCQSDVPGASGGRHDGPGDWHYPHRSDRGLQGGRPVLFIHRPGFCDDGVHRKGPLADVRRDRVGGRPALPGDEADVWGALRTGRSAAGFSLVGSHGPELVRRYRGRRGRHGSGAEQLGDNRPSGRDGPEQRHHPAWSDRGSAGSQHWHLCYGPHRLRSSLSRRAAHVSGADPDQRDRRATVSALSGPVHRACERHVVRPRAPDRQRAHDIQRRGQRGALSICAADHAARRMACAGGEGGGETFSNRSH